MKKTLIGLSIFFALFIGFRAVMISRAAKVLSASEKLIDNFLQRYNEREFSLMFKDYLPARMGGDVISNLEKSMASTYERLGTLNYKKLQKIEAPPAARDSYILRYKASFEKANNITVSFYLGKQKDNSWVIVSCDLDKAGLEK